MILSDSEIRRYIKEGLLVIEPAPLDDQYSTMALDLHFSDEVYSILDPEKFETDKGIEAPVIDTSQIDVFHLLRKYGKRIPKEDDGSFLFPPKKFFLGMTKEYIELPPNSFIAARVEGRSTLARLGLVVHLTAPTIHTGFKGRIALEMCNFGDYILRLHPDKLHVCQLIFEMVEGSVAGSVNTPYQGQQRLNGET